MTGGEPVRGQHLDAFLRRFRDYGLDEDLFTPVYGLSEATIGVTFGELDGSFEMDAINRRTLEREGRAEPLPDDGAREAAERMHLVSVGRPLPGIEVEVVDEDGEPVGDRRLGEVATRGPHVMRGYVGEVDERGAARREDGWLYTGDLGYLSEGQLHIVGRACDRIQVSADRVVFPEEVEFFVDAVDGIYAGRTAVFGTETDEGEGERLVVAFELQSGTVLEDVVEPLGQLLDEHLDLAPDEVVGLSPRSIPRTKSGKVRRFLARKLYEVDRLDRADRTGGLDAVRQLVGRVRREAGSLTERLKSFITGG
jgi:fatty-acyl-CoA synthase